MEKVPTFAPMSKNTSEGRKFVRNHPIVSGSLLKRALAR
jgi:hypothetical protein